jgi:3-hydroxyacyl-[acyl-carrier-protein] dehydratase
MILANDFFVIRSISKGESYVKAELEINSSHKIFEGHFPGQPVVPGVCMMHMIKEILEIVLEKETRLTKADHLKFLSVINPMENNIVNAELKYTIEKGYGIHLTATLVTSTATCFKFKGIFLPVTLVNIF